MHESDQHRVILARGLIDVAIWLVNHPAVPVPETVTIQHTTRGDDDVKAAEVDMVAALTGEPVIGSDDDLAYMVRKNFGPVRYQAVAIPAAARQRTWTQLTSDEAGTEAAA